MQIIGDWRQIDESKACLHCLLYEEYRSIHGYLIHAPQVKRDPKRREHLVKQDWPSHEQLAYLVPIVKLKSINPVNHHQ